MEFYIRIVVFLKSALCEALYVCVNQQMVYVCVSACDLYA